MKLSLRLISATLIFFMVLVATGMGPVTVEARTCVSKSEKYKGVCLIDTNCANVCHTEGFPDGECRGVRHRCFCTKPC